MANFVPVDEFDLVIFGGTGDLAMRKLLPALYHRERDGQITGDSRIIAASRSDLARDAYLGIVEQALRDHLAGDEFNEDDWSRLRQRIHYVQADALDHDAWGDLVTLLAGAEDRVRVAYLATAPSLFGPIATGLRNNGLVTTESRIVLEKPLGHDHASAREINDEVGQCFAENRIYRIDHYLGKETVQNLLALRFANSLFEPLWRRGSIDHVQITVAEDLGVGGRVEFYDKIGALRDMVQNHLMQTVPGYADELGAHTSSTETFVALKLEIDNWRWSNVPFYVRTGKRLPGKHSEIVLQFNEVPHSIFPEQKYNVAPNRLTIRLQPDEGVQLSVMAKEPGPGGFDLRPVSLDLSFEETFGARYPDAYERLLMEVLRGNPALFMRRDEVEAAWHWIDTIVNAWDTSKQKVESYIAGSWGPAASSLLLDRDGRQWLPEV
jgi:glucose-6-phosphate 1-dehydrogenase